MKKGTKIAVITAVLLIVAGLIIFIATMFTLDFDFSKLDNSVYTTNTYEYKDGIKNIRVDTDTANIKVLPCEDETVKVECYEKEDSPHKVTIESNTLIIENADKKWYDYLTVLDISHSEITLYVPEMYATDFSVQTEEETTTVYTSVYQIELETNTGDISVEDINHTTSLTAESSTGDVKVSNCKFEIISAQTDTGDITLNKVNADESLETETDTGHTSINNSYSMNIKSESSTGSVSFINTESGNNLNVETSTGDITFKDSDALYIFAKASTGDITGTVLSAKTFKAESSTGNVSVPGTTGLGVFEAKTSTGDINLSYSVK